MSASFSPDPDNDDDDDEDFHDPLRVSVVRHNSATGIDFSPDRPTKVDCVYVRSLGVSSAKERKKPGFLTSWLPQAVEEVCEVEGDPLRWWWSANWACDGGDEDFAWKWEL